MRTQGDQLREAIRWHCQQLDDSPELAQLLDACNKRGRYLAIRADDGTPSTTERGDHAGRRTWRDFGSGRTLDSYELWLMLTGTDKRRHKWEVVNQWREAQGLRPLNLEVQP